MCSPWPSSDPNKHGIAARLARFLMLMGLLASAGYSQNAFIVNGYYGESNGTTSLSSLISSGATSHLTHLTYAFATSDNNSNPCTGAPTAMNVTDLKNLKAANPNLKILISVGGASAYGVFVNAMPNPTATMNFATNCVSTLLQGYRGYVDGIDIDWEFPQNSTDEQNFNLLLADFRSALNTYAQENAISEHLLLTAALGPESTVNGWEYVDFTGQSYAPGANSSVDFFNVEFYNYAYDSSPTTQSNAPITEINNDLYGNPNAYGAAGLISTGGVPASKIVVGIPFYGVYYTGVSNGTALGGSGTLVSPSSSSGTPTYSQIIGMIGAGAGNYQNLSDTDGSAWSWNSSTAEFWEYDDATSIAQKIQYSQAHQLAGVMSWNLQQDTSGGSLLNQMTAGSAALQFIPVKPCRVADTRNAHGPFGGPEMAAGSTRSFVVPSSACAIPATAKAYSLNVTVVPGGKLQYLTIWPTGQAQPLVSTLNSDGRTKANAAIVAAGVGGAVSVYASNQTQAILDIDGYFVDSGSSESALAYYKVSPCRVVDTRKANGSLGGPYLSGGATRTFPVLSSACNLPASAQAYSLNFTAIPRNAPLEYLTTWPSGQAQPVVSTLNAPTGTVVANAAIVPAGGNGEISVYVTNNTDLAIDVNGYFAATGSGGLSLYAVSPCRALDTRSGSGQFSGTLEVNVIGAACNGSASAQGYVFNATAVPVSSLGYVTLWANGQAQPVVSTLNATDGAITSNMALVPTSNGLIEAYASSGTQLILDISSYFAP